MHSPLLAWYAANKRDLPWRRTCEPYPVWVSEAMLQQTQVATVIPYFERWMGRFPSVEVLAESNEQEVLSVWQGLGYYRRAKLLLDGGRFVVANGWPSTRADWLRVPGVGPYTAAALSSICYGLPEALVDGNVERVFARLTGFGEPKPALTRTAWAWAREQIRSNDPGTWNQALMELGATVCKPQRPDCASCPISSHCAVRKLGLQDRLPAATEKSPTRQVEQQAFVHVCGDLLGIEKIPAGEWWEGMWRFPNRSLVTSEPGTIGTLKHVVTNHRVTLQVSTVYCQDPLPALRWATQDELESIPLPSPQRKALCLILERKA